MCETHIITCVLIFCPCVRDPPLARTHYSFPIQRITRKTGGPTAYVPPAPTAQTPQSAGSRERLCFAFAYASPCPRSRLLRSQHATIAPLSRCSRPPTAWRRKRRQEGPAGSAWRVRGWPRETTARTIWGMTATTRVSAPRVASRARPHRTSPRHFPSFAAYRRRDRRRAAAESVHTKRAHFAALGHPRAFALAPAPSHAPQCSRLSPTTTPVHTATAGRKSARSRADISRAIVKNDNSATGSQRRGPRRGLSPRGARQPDGASKD